MCHLEDLALLKTSLRSSAPTCVEISICELGSEVMPGRHAERRETLLFFSDDYSVFQLLCPNDHFLREVPCLRSSCLVEYVEHSSQLHRKDNSVADSGKPFLASH
jgi:hypothetical protein